MERFEEPVLFDEYDDYDDFYEDIYEDAKSANISCVVWPVNEVGGLYLGNLEAAMNTEELKKRRITSVLTVAAGSMLTYKKEDVANHMIIEAMDTISYNLSEHFEAAIEFIEKNLEKGNVYVHCFAGVSRSSTIVIAYLMKLRKKSASEIFKYVKSKRDIISPNRGFFKQLQSFEKRILMDVKQ